MSKRRIKPDSKLPPAVLALKYRRDPTKLDLNQLDKILNFLP